ncbi:Sec-independent protein translocase subunit TatA [Nocardioides malaquae]|nr:Sec-independent protein translocase subunit TatA [Nocardioides malaquae]
MHSLLLTPMIGLGAPELIIIALVIVLLFGAAKLPELARGSGRALRIFKAETKGLRSDDDTKISAEQVDDDVIDAETPPRRDDTV